MNIGEIKKPSVDGQMVKPKQQISTTTPIESPKSIGDQVDISVKAKERFLQYNKKQKNKRLKSNLKSEAEKKHIDVHIDFTA